MGWPCLTKPNATLARLRRVAFRRVRQLSCALLVLATACGGSATPAATSSPLTTATRTAAAPSPATDHALFTAIQRLDAYIGFVTGPIGTAVVVTKTRDGGATWQRLAIPASHITAVRFIDERVGWAAGFVLRDSPQAACWQAPPTGLPGCRGVVLRTEDGGQSWQQALSIGWDGVRGDPVRQLQALDGLRAWVLAPGVSQCDAECPTELRRTTDGGKTWTTLLRGGLAAIRFASSSRGWIALVDPAGSVEVRATSDGGTTWTSGHQLATHGVPTLDAATTQSAWVMTRDWAACSASNCGQYELFRTDDGGVSWSSLGNPKDSAGSCAFGLLGGPLFASAARGWLTLNLGAGGGQGRTGGLLTTEDGGTTWRCSSTPPNTVLVSAADPLHVWVTSYNGGSDTATVYASNDGGRTWRALDLGGVR
jgi:photosystem II stability/assembly factor-like uncharacterized protein